MLQLKVILKVPIMSEKERDNLTQFKNAVEYCADANDVQVKIIEERVWEK